MSKIIITDDFEKAVKEINPDEAVITDEFKVEDVQRVKELAYIATRDKKTILIAAEKYNNISQNALLKLLEEPPANIDFILLTKSKYALLDTVKSRLIIQKKFYNIKEYKILDIEKLTNDKILEFLKEDMEKEDLKNFIYTVLEQKVLNEEQMKILSDAVKMIELNIDKKAVLALILLAVKEKF